jgi:uncharacterized protein YegP (UPF0339 family)
MKEPDAGRTQSTGSQSSSGEPFDDLTFEDVHSTRSRFSMNQTIIAALMCVAVALVALVVNLSFPGGVGSDGDSIKFAIAAFAAGISAATVVWTVQQARRSRLVIEYEARQASALHFLRDIQELEKKARDVSASLRDSDSETASLGDVISSLESSEVWTRVDAREFRDVLATRNQMVHEPDRVVDPQILATEAASVRRLLGLINMQERAAAQNVLPPAIGGPRQFEVMVGSALRRILGEASVADSVSGEFDYVVSLSTGSVWVEVKYVARGTLALNDVLAAADRAKRYGPGVLVVTNSWLSTAVRELNAASENYSPPVEVVTWQREENDDLLHRALLRVARPLVDPSVTGGRFQIYRDGNGEFRYRLLARNGRVLITSEAYRSSVEAINGINLLRNAAISAPIDDAEHI